MAALPENGERVINNIKTGHIEFQLMQKFKKDYFHLQVSYFYIQFTFSCHFTEDI